MHVRRPKRLSRVADYGLLGIGQGLLRMKSGCQDTTGTEPLVAVSLWTGFPTVIVSLFPTWFLSVPFEIGGFVSFSHQTLLSSTLCSMMALRRRSRGVSPQLYQFQLVHGFMASYLAVPLLSCSYSTSGSYSREKHSSLSCVIVDGILGHLLKTLILCGISTKFKS